MEKLAEEILKTLWGSLIVVTMIMVFQHFFGEDRWWEINVIPALKENSNGPVIYYSVNGLNPEEEVNAELLIQNTSQNNSVGEYGTFENILPGQTVAVKITTRDRSIISPVFFLRDREIRHLIFEKESDELAYLGNRSRLKKINHPTLSVLKDESEKNLIQLDILKEIENYMPLEEAAAKENSYRNDTNKKPDANVFQKIFFQNSFLYLNSFYKNLEK